MPSTTSPSSSSTGFAYTRADFQQLVDDALKFATSLGATSPERSLTTIEALHLEALQDGVVRERIAARVLGDEGMGLSDEARDRIVRAAVMGRA